MLTFDLPLLFGVFWCFFVVFLLDVVVLVVWLLLSVVFVLV